MSAYPGRDTDSGTRTAKRLAYLAVAAALPATLAMVMVLRPATLEAGVLFSAWLLLPYALLACLVVFGSGDRTAAQANLATVVLVAAGGLALLADIIFFHPDAQGPIALLMVPLLQSVGTAVAAPLAHWALRRCRRRRPPPR